MSGPAYTRLDVDERRRRLLELGADLFARFSYDELSMARIAREAGISKALLYHYFPGKQAYFAATLEEKAAELAALTEPDPSLPPIEQLTRRARRVPGLGRGQPRRLRQARAQRRGDPRGPGGRRPRARRHVGADPRRARARAGRRAPPAMRTAVRAWLWFMDGAILDWVEHEDLTREQLRGLLLGTLPGAVGASRR